MTAAAPRRTAGLPLTVNEIFFSIQGEGSRAGQPCVFLRLTGCPLRCRWCDTAYAFHEGRRREPADVLAELQRFPSRLLQLTGGEPLAQAAVYPFLTVLLDAGYQVLVETSGHVLVDKVDPRAVIILDVKAPGSGETARMDWKNLDLLRPQDELKIVIQDRADYEWARSLVRARSLAERSLVLFSPVHGVLAPGVLAGWILEDGLPVRLQVQLHKYLWPGLERGV